MWCIRDEVTRRTALADYPARRNLGNRLNPLKRSFGSVLLFVVLLWFPPEARPADHTAQFIGLGKVDLTPDYPVRLHGYLARKTESEGVIQRVFAKAMAIGRTPAELAVLVSIDNCILPAQVRPELAARLARAGLNPDRLALCVSHTHSAPKLAGAADNIFGADLPPAEQERIERYTREFIDHLEAVALAAIKDRKEASLSWGRTEATFAANRRIKNGPVDHDLPFLVIKDAAGGVRGLVTNYACHCTTLGPEPNRICGDWAGYAQEYLEAAFPGAVAMTLIGCGADANPAPRPGVELAQQHGRSLSSAVTARLAEPLTPVTGRVECRTEQISLPLDTLPTRAELEAAGAKDDPTGYNARKQLARLDRGESLPTRVPYLVQVWDFGGMLPVVFLPGEVVVDYVLRLKKEFEAPRLWVTAYANSVPCYIPSRRVWREGGYEGGRAMIYYDWPTRLAEDTEDRIVAAVHRLMPVAYKRRPPAGAVKLER